MSHNTISDTSNDVTYTFDYDALGRKTTVKVGSQVLSTNVYENDRSGLLSEVQYGNGGKVKYSYDDFDRMTSVKYDAEITPRYEYKYGANGEVAEVEDNNLNRTARTDYDQADRSCQTELRDNTTGEALYKTYLKYDKYNNLVQFAEKAGGESHTSDYSYDRDNRVTEIAYDGTTHKVGYTYDALGRVSSRVVECGVDAGKLTSTYTYVDGGYGTNSTTPLVKRIDQAGIPFEYTYDSRGNIKTEKRGELTTSYEYDALDQLIRVNDPHENKTWVYEYDRGGNITSKVKYAYTTGTLGAAVQTIPYVYGDSNWKDKLTSYNGKAITYDAIGNPLTDGTWTYTWQAGRQLKQMTKSGMTVLFKYDHNGLRVGKVVNGTETRYVLHGKLVTHMSCGSDNLHFFYDAQSRPAKVDFNGTLYTYVHNLQSDIVGILDSTGNLVVEYKYDVWGKPLSATGSLAGTVGKRNPFRYRGYIFDEEAGLYYLRNRYYNPENNRFINADKLLGHVAALVTHHIYAYCGNAPVCKSDESGLEWWNLSSIDWNVYGKAFEDMVSYFGEVFGCVEFEAGAGAGLGGGYKISGILENEGYIGVDMARLTLYDGHFNIDSAIVMDLNMRLSKYHGIEASLRKPASLENPHVDIPWEKNLSLNLFGGGLNGKEMIVSFGASKGVGLGGHFSLGMNATKLKNAKGSLLINSALNKTRDYLRTIMTGYFNNTLNNLKRMVGIIE